MSAQGQKSEHDNVATEKKQPKERRFVDAKTGKTIEKPKHGGSGAAATQALRDEMHAERAGNALPFRIGAAVLWVVGIALEVAAILVANSTLYLPKLPAAGWVVIFLAIDLIAVVAGSQLWKRANHLAPASKENKLAYWVQTELGVIVAVIAFAPMIVFAFLKARDAGSRKERSLWALLFAVCTFFGAQIRFPTIIAAIACLIAALFEKRAKLTALLAAPLALVFAVGGSAVNAANKANLGAANIAQNKLPKLHYIAMGLPVQSDEGYGQYGYGGWLIFSTSFDDPQARDEALRQEVVDRAYTLAHHPAQLLSTLSRKNLSTFGRGTFNLNEIFEADAHEADNAVKQAVFENGRFNRAYTHLATAMFVAQMALACIACIQAIRRRDTRAAPLFLTLLGAFLFLSIWETRARYFFQFMMILLCAGAMFETPSTHAAQKA